MRTIYDVDTIECNRVTREQICLTGTHYKFTYCKEYPLVPAQMLSIRASLSLYSYNDENLNKLVRAPKPCMRPNIRPRAELAFPYCSRTMWHPVAICRTEVARLSSTSSSLCVCDVCSTRWNQSFCLSCADRVGWRQCVSTFFTATEFKNGCFGGDFLHTKSHNYIWGAIYRAIAMEMFRIIGTGRELTIPYCLYSWPLHLFTEIFTE